MVDSGIGIKKEDEWKIFSMFGSVKDEKVNVHGVGLGLVISRLLVHKFDGVIDFYSTPNRGSNFFFTFKLEELAPNDIAPSSLVEMDSSEENHESENA